MKSWVVLSQRLYHTTKVVRNDYIKRKSKYAKLRVDSAMTNITRISSSQFQKKWKYVKEALRMESQQCAVLNNRLENTQLIELLKKEKTINISEAYAKSVSESKPINHELIQFVLNEKGERIKSQDEESDDDGEEQKYYDDDDEEEDKRTQMFAPKRPLLSRDFESGQSLGSRLLNVEQTGIAKSLPFGHLPATEIYHTHDVEDPTDVFRENKVDVLRVPVTKLVYGLPFEWPFGLQAYALNRVPSEDDENDILEPVYDDVLKLETHKNVELSALLPIILLQLCVNDRYLDLCASPGILAYCVMQSEIPLGSLTLNDKKRGKKLGKLVSTSVYPYEAESIDITDRNGLQLTNEKYEKILVDAPCSEDRWAASDEECPIYKMDESSRSKRLELPRTQARLLKVALESVPVEGSVVYTTKTMNILENEGVVQLVLTQIAQEGKIEVMIIDCRETLKHLKFLYNFQDRTRLKFGDMVYPTLKMNCGPRYVCKFVRKK